MPKASFDKVAKIYDETIPCHIRNHYLGKRLNFIKGIFKKGLVLDVGCGTGILDYQLENNGFEVIGVDISREMLREALKRGCSKDMCASATALPFKSESFDLVISVVMLHHLAEAQVVYEALKEMVRVTNKQGTILIWDHNPLNPYWSIFMKRLPQDNGVKRVIPLSEIIQHLRKIGAQRITYKRLGFVPDFIPPFLLKPFEILEKIIESLPLLNKLCAHNVIIAKKG